MAERIEGADECTVALAWWGCSTTLPMVSKAAGTRGSSAKTSSPAPPRRPSTSAETKASSSTTGSDWASMWMASKSQAASQSASPRQPQKQPLPPPATIAAARQLASPS